MAMPGGASICHSCEQRHLEALDAMSSGRFTGECSECGLSADELRARQKCGPHGEMAVHFEGGRYRVMCLPCDRSYVPKRLELYGGTQFAQDSKLN